jgi:hypothetical protein
MMPIFAIDTIISFSPFLHFLSLTAFTAIAAIVYFFDFHYFIDARHISRFHCHSSCFRDMCGARQLSAAEAPPPAI